MKNNMVDITKTEIVTSAFTTWWAWYLKIPCHGIVAPITLGTIKSIKYMMNHQKRRNEFFTFFRHLKEYFKKKDFKLSGLIFVGMELITWVIGNKFNINNTWYLLPFISSIPLDILIRYFKLEHYNDLIVKRLEQHYKEDVKFIENIDGKLTLRSFIPLDINDSDKLMLCTNTTIVNIKQDLMRKQFYIIKHGKGIEVEYRKMPKNSEQRLTSILKSYGDNPIFIEMKQSEIDDKFIYMSRLGIKRINKLLEDIEHKLGAKKDYLTVEYDEGKVTFTIKTIEGRIFYMDDIIPKTERPKGYKFPFIVGINKDNGKPRFFDFESIQHFILGGMTGAGKSTTLHGWIKSLMYWNDDLFFYMIDLKGTELPHIYGDFRNCKVAGIEDFENELESVNGIVSLVNDVHSEYRKRIRLFSEKGVKDIDEYNKKFAKLPHIIFIIDEVNYLYEYLQKRYSKQFDLIEANISTLKSRGRSTGIYCGDTMQNITEKTYNIAWRRSAMSRCSMKMAELKQCQMIIEDMPEVADKAFKQRKGEYIFAKDGKVFELQNMLMTNDEKDITYNKLCKKYKRSEGHVQLEKDTGENQET